MAVKKNYQTRVVVMENEYKETSLHLIYEVKQWLLNDDVVLDVSLYWFSITTTLVW